MKSLADPFTDHGAEYRQIKWPRADSDNSRMRGAVMKAFFKAYKVRFDESPVWAEHLEAKCEAFLSTLRFLGYEVRRIK